MFLNLANSIDARLLLIDADFQKYVNSGEVSESQFRSRCEILTLPTILDRPHDIPYILLGMLDELCPSCTMIKFDKAALAGVINWFLVDRTSEQSPRSLWNMAKKIIANIRPNRFRGPVCEINVNDIPKDIGGKYIDKGTDFGGVIEFYCRKNPHFSVGS